MRLDDQDRGTRCKRRLRTRDRSVSRDAPRGRAPRTRRRARQRALPARRRSSPSVLAAEFDLALSRFGVMFFEDPVAAFANIASAIRTGGRFVFLCWQDLARND